MSGFSSPFGNLPSPAAIVALTAAALLVYVYAGYPILLAVVSRFFPRRRPEPVHTPSLSVLISAYNEESAIARKIEQTLALQYPADRLEVLVVSDRSTG